MKNCRKTGHRLKENHAESGMNRRPTGQNIARQGAQSVQSRKGNVSTRQRRKADRESGQKTAREENFCQKKGREADGERREPQQFKNREKSFGNREQTASGCIYMGMCGGCQYQGIPYLEQLKKKQEMLETLLRPFGKPEPILGMENPLHYRNKVHAVFGRTARGEVISGIYQAGTHHLIGVEECRIEDLCAQKIIHTIRDLLKSFKIKTYDEDTGYGLLRHVLIRRGFASGQVMVVLVLASPILPAKRQFTAALCKAHPEITTVVLNVNDKHTSMVLGERNIPLYGKGYIEDRLCGCTFRISPRSFYQVNPVQTERLYGKAMEFAGLTGKERVIDAYCGIGTIGLIAAPLAREVIGIELNPEAVRDARSNARRNHITNAVFYEGDAGKFLVSMANAGEKADVVFLDPPRSGSDEAFLSSVIRLGPDRIVYISCGPETLARDLKYLTGHGYRVKRIQPVDLFCFTGHVETIVLMSRSGK